MRVFFRFSICKLRCVNVKCAQTVKGGDVMRTKCPIVCPVLSCPRSGRGGGALDIRDELMGWVSPRGNFTKGSLILATKWISRRYTSVLPSHIFVVSFTYRSHARQGGYHVGD